MMRKLNESLRIDQFRRDKQIDVKLTKGSHFGAISVLALILSGCGGGGGDAARQFASFLEMEPGETHQFGGIAVFAATTDLGGGQVDASEPEIVEDPNVEVSLDGSGDVSKASMSLPPGEGFGTPVTFRFNADNDVIVDGEVIGDFDPDLEDAEPILTDFQIATSASDDGGAIIADPIAKGFQYQTFGIWETGIDDANGHAGALSVGAPTLPENIPVTDTGIYDGMSAGLYLDADGTPFSAFADFDAIVEFDTGDVTVFSSDTMLIADSDGSVSANPGLDYVGTGSLDFADGSFFVGNLAADTLDLAGTMQGLLYGPNGEELGAVFSTSGADGEYIGAVGAVGVVLP